MATTPTTEARELALLDKVELRIALAQSDTALESSLKTYLAPVLLKLASEHVAVRNKVKMKHGHPRQGPLTRRQVISICQHVNTRLAPELVLPFRACLKYQ